ncbi:hypothetical protein Tco_0072033 [Tanacetum coccineum]
MLLAQAQEARVILDEEHLAFLANTRERVDSGLDVQALTTTAIFQIDDLDAFDLDCDDAPTKSAVLVRNSLYVTTFTELPFALAKKHDAISVIDTEETLRLAKESRIKMKENQNDPIVKEKRVNITPIDYTSLNKLAMYFYDDLVKYVDMEKSYIDEYNKCLEPKAELFKKKDVVEKELDLQPLSPKLRKNMEAHVDYLKITKEHTHALRGIVEQARALKPLDNALHYACNFAEFSNTSGNTTQKQVDAHSNQNTNRPFLPSTGLTTSTNASESQPGSNTRNNRISQPSSSNIKYKRVEVHHRNVKSNLNKTNHVCVCNENVKHGMLNAYSEYVCSTCNECLFSANHDMCIVDYLNDVNVRARTKSIKSVKKNEWKPTSKVFTNVGHRW